MQRANHLNCHHMSSIFCIGLMCLLRKQTLKIQWKDYLSHHQTYIYNNFWNKDSNWNDTCSYGIFLHSSIIVSATGLCFTSDMIDVYKIVFTLVGAKRVILTCLNFANETFIAFSWLMIRSTRHLSTSSLRRVSKKEYWLAPCDFIAHPLHQRSFFFLGSVNTTYEPS
jgi:hypothetical protein